MISVYVIDRLISADFHQIKKKSTWVDRREKLLSDIEDMLSMKHSCIHE